MLRFKDVWINPPNLVSIEAGNRNMESVKGKPDVKVPTVEVVCVGKKQFFDCNTFEEAEQLRDEWAKAMIDYNAHWMR